MQNPAGFTPAGKISSDERQRSAVTERIANAVAAVGVPGADKVAGFLEARRTENRDLLIRVLRDELQRLMHKFDTLSESHRTFMQTDFAT